MNTGVGFYLLFQGIFPTPGTEPMSLMFPALASRFFTTGATWKVQVVHIYTDEWIKKMSYIYTMEYYSAIKKE